MVFFATQRRGLEFALLDQVIVLTYMKQQNIVFNSLGSKD